MVRASSNANVDAHTMRVPPLASDGDRAARIRRAALLIFLFLALDIAFLGWVWARFGSWGIWDWDYQATVVEAARTAIVDHHQLPLWNPFMGGGFTLVGTPTAMPFSPGIVPALLFGTVRGLQISILLYLIVGQLGTYLLARYNGMGVAASSLAAVLVTLGGCVAQHVAHGQHWWLAFLWVPFVLLFLHRALDERSWRLALASGFFLGLVFLDGGPYQHVFTPLFLAAYAVVLVLERRSARPVAALLVAVLVALGVAAVRLVPTTEAFLQYPRPTQADHDYYAKFYGIDFQPSAGRVLFDSLLSRRQVHDRSRWMPYVVEVSCYVGLVPLLLALVGSIAAWRRSWPLGLLLLASTWIVLGAAAPVDLWAWLHPLPVLSSLQVPARFNFFVALCLALLAARGLDVVARVAARGLVPRRSAAAVIGVVALDLLAVNGALFEPAFSVTPIATGERGPFRQYWQSPYKAQYPAQARYPLWQHWPSGSFPAIRENAGVISTQYDLPYPRRARPFEERGYRGEAWGRHASTTVRAVDVTPNRITLHTSGAGGRVIVNQNFHPGWRVAGGVGAVADDGGLLAVVGVPRGDQTLSICFLPRSFLLGAAITLATLALLAASLTTGRRARRPSESRPAAPPPRS